MDGHGEPFAVPRGARARLFRSPDLLFAYLDAALRNGQVLVQSLLVADRDVNLPYTRSSRELLAECDLNPFLGVNLGDELLEATPILNDCGELWGNAPQVLFNHGASIRHGQPANCLRAVPGIARSRVIVRKDNCVVIVRARVPVKVLKREGIIVNCVSLTILLMARRRLANNGRLHGQASCSL